MIALRALAVACICTLPLAAAAQWQWIDKDGRKVFSDQAPPPDIPAKSILRQPGQRASQPAPEAAAAPPSAPAQAAAPKVSGRDKELEQRKKQAEAAEAEKKKAQEAEYAAQQEESCKRARQAKAGFDSGVKIASLNEKGERQVLDDKQRAAEVTRIEKVIASDCPKS